MASGELTVLDENGDCPICCDKPENVMKTPCCKTIICQDCLWVFNDGKTEHKCTNCNTNITLLFRQRKDINDLNSGEISFTEFFDRYPRVINVSNVHKLSTQRLFKKNDHFIMYMRHAMDQPRFNPVNLIIYNHIKTSINWQQEVFFGDHEVRPLAYAYLYRTFEPQFIVNGIKTLTEVDFSQLFPGDSPSEPFSYIYLMSRCPIQKSKPETKEAFNELARFIISRSPRSILNNIKMVTNFFQNGSYSIVSDLMEFLNPDSFTFKNTQGKTIVDLAFESNDRAIICQILTMRPDIFTHIECNKILKILLTNHDLFEEFKNFIVFGYHSLFEVIILNSNFKNNSDYKSIVPPLITFFKKYGRSNHVIQILSLEDFENIVNYSCSCGSCFPVLFSENNFKTPTDTSPSYILNFFNISNLQEIHHFIYSNGTQASKDEFKKMTEHLRILPPSIMPLTEYATGGGCLPDDT